MSCVRFAICNLCDASCGLEIETHGREILSIRGDEDDPFSQGHICPKATAQKDIYDDPDRLRRPVRRRGDRWEEISWEDAIAEVSRRVVATQSRYGDDALGIYFGNPIGHSYQTMLALFAFGKMARTRNVFSSASVDAHPRMLVSSLLYGNQALLPVPDIERTNFFVIQGANPIISNGSIMTAPGVKRRLRAIRDRGGRIVVIDPRFTETAAVADEHHFIRPGADALFLLAVLHALEADGRFDPRARQSARGVDELATIVRAYPPERVTGAVGIAPEAIRDLARRFAESRPAVWYGRMGTSAQEFGCLSTWLIDAINVVTGNFDQPGGAMFTTPAVDLAGLARRLGETGTFDRWRSRVGGLPELGGEFPVAALADEIETPGQGQIRALITIAGNPVLAVPNGRRLDGALDKLEFMAAVDFYVNEATRHADVILPPVTALEGDHYPMLEYAMAIRNVAHYAKAVVTPEAGARRDWRILTDLMAGIGRERGGLGRLAAAADGVLGSAIGSGLILDLLLRMGPQRLRRRGLEQQPHGIDLGPLEPRARKVVNTRGGYVNLVPDRLFPDLLRLDEKLVAKAVEENGDGLLLISRRTLRSMNSWLHNIPRLVGGRARCTLLMHPEDARALGLESGKTVRVKSRVGEIRVPLEVTARVMRGVVSLPYGWGHDRPGARQSVARMHAAASLNDIADDALYDRISGTSVVNGIPVRVTH